MNGPCDMCNDKKLTDFANITAKLNKYMDIYNSIDIIITIYEQ